MEERDFFDERPEQRTHTMTCPHCGQPGEYEVSWLVRRKLLAVSKRTVTATPCYTVLSPWRDHAKRLGARGH